MVRGGNYDIPLYVNATYNSYRTVISQLINRIFEPIFFTGSAYPLVVANELAS